MISLKDRFDSKWKLDESTGCWQWIGAVHGGGYGQIYSVRKRSEAAHRVSYQLYVGDIPEDMFVLHRCDNPLCVNPDHLWLGTQKDNLLDRDRKGRGKHIVWACDGTPAVRIKE